MGFESCSADCNLCPIKIVASLTYPSGHVQFLNAIQYDITMVLAGDSVEHVAQSAAGVGVPWDHHGRPGGPLILLNSVHEGGPVDALSANSFISIRSLLKAADAYDSFIAEICQSWVPSLSQLISFDLGHLFKEGAAQVLVPSPEVS